MGPNRALTADFFAENAPRFLSFESIEAGAKDSGVVFEPLGVVLAIMPWNYPFWQFFRFALPALAAGNGAILKYANNVPRSALAVQDILDQAGLAPGLCATVLIEPERVADIIAGDRIAAVTLTGSTHVGSIVAAQAGAALKKQVLGLGGSDPFIVLRGRNFATRSRPWSQWRHDFAVQHLGGAARQLFKSRVGGNKSEEGEHIAHQTLDGKKGAVELSGGVLYLQWSGCGRRGCPCRDGQGQCPVLRPLPSHAGRPGLDGRFGAQGPECVRRRVATDPHCNSGDLTRRPRHSQPLSGPAPTGLPHQVVRLSH